ncbi:MAG: exodeoxyribonuclease VII small subunit [Planctomycetota bacterium]
MAKAKPDPESAKDTGAPDFEQSLERLEDIARGLEEGKLSLTESLANYEEGVKLLRHCYDLLKRAERKIELLTGVDADGNPITEPFDAEATFSADDNAMPRSGRTPKKS